MPLYVKRVVLEVGRPNERSTLCCKWIDTAPDLMGIHDIHLLLLFWVQSFSIAEEEGREHPMLQAHTYGTSWYS